MLNFAQISTRFVIYEKITMIEKEIYEVEISVKTTFLLDESLLPEGPFRYKYDVVVQNHLPYSIQLLRRQWNIEHLLLGVAEIEGEGVIGLQPEIKPDGKFTYSSFTEFFMPYGKMTGHYTFKNLFNEELFIVKIPEFTLVYPTLLN